MRISGRSMQNRWFIHKHTQGQSLAHSSFCYQIRSLPPAGLSRGIIVRIGRQASVYVLLHILLITVLLPHTYIPGLMPWLSPKVIANEGWCAVPGLSWLTHDVKLAQIDPTQQFRRQCSTFHRFMREIYWVSRCRIVLLWCWRFQRRCKIPVSAPANVFCCCFFNFLSTISDICVWTENSALLPQNYLTV